MNISFVSLAVLQKNVLGSNYKSFWSFCIFGGWFNNAPFVKRCRLISEPATAKLSSSWCGGQGYSEPPGGFHWTTRPSKIVNRKPKLGGLSLVTRGWCNICSQCLLEHAGCTSPTRYVGNCITKEKQLPYQLEYQKNTCLVARTPCCLMIMIALLPSFTSFRKGLANHLRVIQHINFPATLNAPLKFRSKSPFRAVMFGLRWKHARPHVGLVLQAGCCDLLCGCLWKPACLWSPLFLAGRFRWRSSSWAPIYICHVPSCPCIVFSEHISSMTLFMCCFMSFMTIKKGALNQPFFRRNQRFNPQCSSGSLARKRR